MAHFQGRAVSFGDGNFHRVYHTGAKDSVKKGVSCDARVHSASKNKRSSKMTQGPVVVGWIVGSKFEGGFRSVGQQKSA